MTSWLIDKIIHDANHETLINTLKKHNIIHKIVDIVPFGGTITGRIPCFPEGKVIAIGSTGVTAVCKWLNLQPGTFFSPEKFNPVAYKQFGTDFLNHDLEVIPFSKLMDYYSPYGEYVFIRPNTDNKEFAGEVMVASKVGQWAKNLVKIGYIDHTDFDVIISPAKNLGPEYRFFIADGTIIDYCVYRTKYESKRFKYENKAAENFVLNAINKYQPDRMFMIDIVEHDDNTFSVIECGCMNHCSWYAMDIEKIVLYLQENV